VVFSGDMVKHDEDGFLYYVSRRDRMIKTLGYRVGPDEILDVLHASGEIADGIVTSEPDRRRGDAIVAYVVLRSGGSLERLTAFYRVELPRYMHPARIEIRDDLPRMPNGKHDLMALRAEVMGAKVAAVPS
jgi:acyl-coenzyme A synthetase/AMP-(fatty) acid ligase